MYSKAFPLCPHPANGRYLLYRDDPRVLICASEHYGAVLNRSFDYVRYLDEAADKKATLSRCFLLFRELEGSVNPHSPCKPTAGEYLCAFRRTGPGNANDGYEKFDLTQWDDEFFARLRGFLGEAQKRGIIVELTLFSNTYGDPVWRLNPFNAANNVNGVGDIAWQDYNSFRDPQVAELQMAYVRKVVQEANEFDNFYFEVCNEPFGGATDHATVAEVEEWEEAIQNTIRTTEAFLPVRHMIAQTPAESWRQGSELDSLIEAINVDMIDIHDYHMLTIGEQAFHPLDRFMDRDLRLRNIQKLWRAAQVANKPIIFDEDNACSSGLDAEAWTIHRKRAWATVCSGGHYDMIDFSIQAAGGEAGSPAARAHIRTWLKHLSEFIHTVDFPHTTPAPDFCQQLPVYTVASVLANPGKEYVVYIADEREIGEPGRGTPITRSGAQFLLPEGSYNVRFYDPAGGVYIGEPVTVGAGWTTVRVPDFVDDIVIHIKAE